MTTFQPTHVINRGYRTNPNPNYVDQADQEVVAQNSYMRPSASTPDVRSTSYRSDFSSPLKPQTTIKQPVFRPTAGGGSLGVFSHAASPLRKSASTNFTPARTQPYDNTNGSRTIQSPEKRRSTPGGGLQSTNVAAQRWGHLKPDKTRRETGHF